MHWRHFNKPLAVSVYVMYCSSKVRFTEKMTHRVTRRKQQKSLKGDIIQHHIDS